MTHHSAPQPFQSSKAGALKGTAAIPGDKSISHRSLMFGGLAEGKTTVHGLLEGEDVLRTADAMRAMGAKIEQNTDGTWSCEGVGVGNLQEPACVLDMGNSGTSTRLLAGLIGGHNITAFMTGDNSLIKRPMKRIMTPLEQMGVTFMTREGGRLPMALKGTPEIKAIEYRLPVASAQVKSAILLAGLNAKSGRTTVIEEIPTRDHTENMLRHFGVKVDVEKRADGTEAIHLEANQKLRGADIYVPSDPSSAAFPAVAALINKGSDILLPRIGMNERRNGVFVTLMEMGADITLENERIEAGEPVADLRIRGSKMLQGVTVPESRVASMIDEFPILAVAASFANGTTYMSGLEELRVKESDRLLMMAEGLKACGVDLDMGESTLTIHGTGKAPKGGASIETALDHRIAMSFLILGTASENPVQIDDYAPVNTSFPNFSKLINDLAKQGSGEDQPVMRAA